MGEPFLLVLQDSAALLVHDPMFVDYDDDDDDEDNDNDDDADDDDVDNDENDDEVGEPFLLVLQDSARADGWVESKLTPNLRFFIRDIKSTWNKNLAFQGL